MYIIIKKICPTFPNIKIIDHKLLFMYESNTITLESCYKIFKPCYIRVVKNYNAEKQNQTEGGSLQFAATGSLLSQTLFYQSSVPFNTNNS